MSESSKKKSSHSAGAVKKAKETGFMQTGWLADEDEIDVLPGTDHGY